MPSRVAAALSAEAGRASRGSRAKPMKAMNVMKAMKVAKARDIRDDLQSDRGDVQVQSESVQSKPVPCKAMKVHEGREEGSEGLVFVLWPFGFVFVLRRASMIKQIMIAVCK